MCGLQRKAENVTSMAKSFQGTVPSNELLNQVRTWSEKTLRKERAKLDQALGAFNGINKLAASEIQRHEEAKAKFSERRESALEDHEAVTQLMDDIEEKRRSKMDFTYSQISRYFSEIFRELVPEGEARMEFLESPPLSSYSSSSGRGDTPSCSRRRQGGPVADKFSYENGMKFNFFFPLSPPSLFPLTDGSLVRSLLHRRRRDGAPVRRALRRALRRSEGGGGARLHLRHPEV